MDTTRILGTDAIEFVNSGLFNRSVLISHIPITTPFALGLEAALKAVDFGEPAVCSDRQVTKVFKEYTGETIDFSIHFDLELNLAFTRLVRVIANESGWLEGWKALAMACPDCGMHDQLMQNVATGIDVFKSVKVSTLPHEKLDIKFRVTANPSLTSIPEIGPKTPGGHNWEKDEQYKKVVKSRNAPIDLPMGLCPFYAWIGVAKKVESSEDVPKEAAAFWTSQLLGIVDYDFDKDERNMKGGIRHAIKYTAEMGIENDHKLRGAAWIGLLTMDRQCFNRSVQMKWVKEGQGNFVLGPDDIDPEEFGIAGYVDCAALAPFAYQSAEQLLPSRLSMFVAVSFANQHDLLFDMGCSSRISCAAYADAAGVFKYDLPQAWTVGMIDAIATRALNGMEDQKPLYPAWERFIKYTRMLRKSESKVSAGILKRAQQGLVLVPKNWEESIGDAFERLLDPANASKMVNRKACTTEYQLSEPAKHLQEYRVDAPELCEKCFSPLLEAFFKPSDTIQAIPGIPSTVTRSAPVSIAAAIRRGPLFAITSECCDLCACRIGLWANRMSDKAVISIMIVEPSMSLREWLLCNYFMACVAFSPLRMVSVLANFDLNADISFEDGAMGVRDVADC
ncbi:hypothetical protein BKA64DRAFT_739338 [Cadophora sp. MPI-SDFR-AT-0126]|nr:hypothetical protein BKA64DRAFT_739338 [Leotiomycetes sp. MPI-SDFR-AT-0126]